MMISDGRDTPPPPAAPKLETAAARTVLALRWIMAPIYIGLFGALLIDLAIFMQKLVQAVPKALSMNVREALLTVLSLIDLALIGNLVLIVIFAGWTNVIGPLPGGSRTTDNLSNASFGDVKLKLIGSVAAIATIQTLESLVHMEEIAAGEALWRLAVLVAIGGVGVLLALMDRIAAGGHE